MSPPSLIDTLVIMLMMMMSNDVDDEEVDDDDDDVPQVSVSQFTSWSALPAASDWRRCVRSRWRRDW